MIKHIYPIKITLTVLSDCYFLAYVIIRPTYTHTHTHTHVRIFICIWGCLWYNGYRRRKWTRRHEFKSRTRLIAFHIVLIP